MEFSKVWGVLIHDFAMGDIWEAVIAAIAIAIIFFLCREKIFGLPDLSGYWYLKSITEESNYHPYLKMELHHNLFLRLEDKNIRGSSEKVYENSSYGMRNTHEKHVLTYTGKYRARAKIEGSIQKNIFGPDILTLHAIEYGERRQSTICCRFELKKKYIIFNNNFDNGFQGDFFSMVADQKGKCSLSQEPFAQVSAEIKPK